MLHYIFCASILAMVIWRGHKANKLTEKPVRAALTLLATATLYAIVAALRDRLTVQPPLLALELAFAALLMASNKQWKFGAPSVLQVSWWRR